MNKKYSIAVYVVRRCELRNCYCGVRNWVNILRMTRRVSAEPSILWILFQFWPREQLAQPGTPNPESFQAHTKTASCVLARDKTLVGAQTVLPKSPWTANLKIFGRYEFAHGDKHRILWRLTIEKKILMILASIFWSIVDDTHTSDLKKSIKFNHHQFVDHSPGPLPTCWAQNLFGALRLRLHVSRAQRPIAKARWIDRKWWKRMVETPSVDPQQFQGWWKPRLNQGFSINNPAISQFKSWSFGGKKLLHVRSQQSFHPSRAVQPCLAVGKLECSSATSAVVSKEKQVAYVWYPLVI